MEGGWLDGGGVSRRCVRRKEGGLVILVWRVGRIRLRGRVRWRGGK